MKSTYLHLISLQIYNRLMLMAYVMGSPVIVCYFRCTMWCNVHGESSKASEILHSLHMFLETIANAQEKKRLQMSEQFFCLKSKNYCGIFHVSQNTGCPAVKHLHRISHSKVDQI